MRKSCLVSERGRGSRGRKRQGAVTVTPGIRRASTATTRDDPRLTAPPTSRATEGEGLDRENQHQATEHDGEGVEGEEYESLNHHITRNRLQFQKGAKSRGRLAGDKRGTRHEKTGFT